MKVISLENLKTFYNNSKKSFGNMTNITYAELKTLRDNSQLVEGQYYRITDFVTTVDQEDAKSAGHRFDIIVLATSSNTLNENALAVKHAEDTYFDNSNLDAWELKYDLDNDKSKYAWADETNGKGVIYYMKDEFNNECSYDFKNVLFKRYKLKNMSGLHLADYPLSQPDYKNATNQAFINLQSILGSSMKYNNISLYYTRGIYIDGYLVSGADIYNYDSSYESYDEGAFVFDENSGGNYVAVYSSYDCFDIIAEVENTNGEWFYTFSKKATGADVAVDASLSKLIKVQCYNNSIKEYINNRLYLNNNIFITLGNGGSMYENNFNTNCYNNTFGASCNSNTFGKYCSHDTFGANCKFNTFGNDCSSNTFGEGCSSNTFGEGCSSNTFGNDCSSNTFGTSCSINTFEKNCYSNTFGNSCSSNTFGNSCYSNTFGTSCSINTFDSGACEVSFELYTTGSSMEIRYLTIYQVSSTTIPADLITLNANYSQILGLNSSGELVCKSVLG